MAIKKGVFQSPITRIVTLFFWLFVISSTHNVAHAVTPDEDDLTLVRQAYAQLGNTVQNAARSHVGDSPWLNAQRNNVASFLDNLELYADIFAPEEFSIIVEGVNNMLDHLETCLERCEDRTHVVSLEFTRTVRSGGQGRPRKEIHPEILSRALQERRGPTHLAPVFNCCSRTIRRRALEQGLVQPCPPVYVTYEDADTGQTIRIFRSSTAPVSSLTDEQLDAIVRHILTVFPAFGRRMIRGHLEHMGHHVPRERLRQAYERVNGPAALATNMIVRGRYSVAGPNSLWHHDGQHGMIRYRVVIHAFVDGFSRLVTGIRANDNNRAETVANLFHDAREQHGTPSRVRGDHGTENLQVAEFMETNFGVERGSYIWGRSVHNIRIERLWRDVTQGFGSKWKAFFQDLEHHCNLNPDNDAHIWLLHYLFLPSINQDALEWAESWNHHNLRITDGDRERSPRDLFFFGTLENGYRNLAVGFNPEDENDAVVSNLEGYGVDWRDLEDDGLLAHHQAHNPLQFDDLDTPFQTHQPSHLSLVDVPTFVCPFDENQARQFEMAMMVEVGEESLLSRDMGVRRNVWTEALRICTSVFA